MDVENDREAENLFALVKSLYDGKLNVSTGSVAHFHTLAEYIGDEELLEKSTDFLKSNITSGNLLDAWRISEVFEEACCEFVTPDSYYCDWTTPVWVKNIGQLCKDKFLRIDEKMQGLLSGRTSLQMKRVWLKENKSDENVKEVILNTNFSVFSIDEKWKVNIIIF